MWARLSALPRSCASAVTPHRRRADGLERTGARRVRSLLTAVLAWRLAVVLACACVLGLLAALHLAMASRVETSLAGPGGAVAAAAVPRTTADDAPPAGKVIWAIFAGRRYALETLLRYVDVLMRRGEVDELHLWLYNCQAAASRLCKSDDENTAWIVSTFADRAATSTMGGRVTLMRPTWERKNERWRPFYAYYAAPRFARDVIVKSDDDVVFVDVDRFAAFVALRRQLREPLALYASIINNAAVQDLQLKAGLLPAGFYPPLFHYKSIVTNRTEAERVHAYFLAHARDVVRRARQLHSGVARPPPGTRVSINLFAMLGADFAFARSPFFLNDTRSDEHFISIEYYRLSRAVRLLLKAG